MTQLLGAVQFVLILLVSGYVIYYIDDAWCRMRTQKEYEKAFVKYHQTNIDLQETEPKAGHFIPLPFALRHSSALLHLCEQHKPSTVKDVWTSTSDEKYEPKIEVISMRLRRLAIPKGIIRVEAIRCGFKYALIAAEDRSSGYVLKEDNLNLRVYNIYTKFQREPTSSEDVEKHIQEIKADIKAD